MTQRTREIIYDFRGHLAIPATASGSGIPWTKADTSAAGSPTVQGANGGGIALTFDNTNEVQNLCLYMGDVLPFDIDDIIRAEFIAKVAGTLDAATTMIFGLGTARNDTPDSVAQNAWFRLQGNNTVLCETDDNVTDKDDVATGLTLSTAFKRFAIDFSSSVVSRDPPLTSLGGKGNVQFFAGNLGGALRRVASGTHFDMSGYAGNLQLMAQIQKTASTNTDALTILQCSIEVKMPDA